MKIRIAAAALALQIGCANAQPVQPGNTFDGDIRYKAAPVAEIPAKQAPVTAKDGFSFVAVGDLLGGRPMLPLKVPGFERIVELIKSGDAAVGNAEGAIYDGRFLRIAPQGENGGGYPLAMPGTAEDLKAIGFSLLAKANNHATDFGVDGLKATIDALNHAGIVTAGAGDSLTDAYEPRFLDTANGRIGFVATASTFTPMSVAGDAAGQTLGRPGINVVHTRRTVLVTSPQLANLKDVASQVGDAPAPSSHQVTILGQTYRESDTPGLTYEANANDETRLLRSIRNAKQSSDFVVFSIHAHELATTAPNERRPADFLPPLYHNVIDAGADIVVAHGPHKLEGIEIYHGRPIFYSLGTFAWLPGEQEVTPDLFENLGLDPRKATNSDYRDRYFASYPREFFESVIAISRFEGGHVREVRLYPIEMGSDRPGQSHGLPLPAAPDLAKKILNRLVEASTPFGTRISIENGVGVIRVP